AITAWSAKVVTSSICLSVNGSTVARVRTSTPIGFPSRNIGTPSAPRDARRLQQCQLRIALHIGNVDGPALKHDATCNRSPIRTKRMIPHVFDVIWWEPVAGDLMVDAVP